ncbi:hypothetical protein [Candidatus Enterococcus palustris]|nr:hypothetical protein [Enterococcus sp. 7F3_DIV0205]
MNYLIPSYRQNNDQQESIEYCLSKKDFCVNPQSYYDQLIKSFEKNVKIK